MARDPRTTRLICPLTAPTVGGMLDMLAAARAAGADAVEFRLDFLSQTPTRADLQALLAGLDGDAVVTCRPAREGGRYAGDEADRLALLQAAAEFPRVTVDVEQDVPAAPAGCPIRSHHDFQKIPADLESLYASLARAGGIPKVAFAAAGPEDALRALGLLRRGAGIALAMGEAGVASRILAKKFGAWGTFAALSAGTGSAPGQPTLEQFKALYRWDAVGPASEVYGVIGCPIAHSMSPALHNAAFAAAGRNAVYVPLLIQPDADSFSRFMDALLERPWLDWRGLSVTIPHKEHALAYVGASRCDELAVRIGAVNTITIAPDGSLRGDNTDYAAAIDALCAAMGISRPGLAGEPVAVLGAGGAARAIVAALRRYGAAVTVFNRTLDRARSLAEEFGCSFAPLDASAGADARVVINCTSIGMHPKVGDCPLEAIPAGVRVVFDTIYNPVETQLILRAKRAGCLTVTGVDMFVNQAVAQFEIWTNTPAPRDAMRKVVVDRLSGEGTGQ